MTLLRCVFLIAGISCFWDFNDGPAAGLVRWLFLSISHVPNQEARQAYERHAKREQAPTELIKPN